MVGGFLQLLSEILWGPFDVFVKYIVVWHKYGIGYSYPARAYTGVKGSLSAGTFMPMKVFLLRFMVAGILRHYNPLLFKP